MRPCPLSLRASVLVLTLSALACGGGGGETESDGGTTASTGPSTTGGTTATADTTTADPTTDAGVTGTSGPTPSTDATASTEDPTDATSTAATTAAETAATETTGSSAGDSPCGKPWPDASNTGIPAGTPELMVIEGDFHTEQDGQVFDAVELRGRLYVDHKDIKITRSRLVGDEWYALYATETASGLTLEDVDVVGGLLLPDNTTIRRAHAHAPEGGYRDDGFIFAASHVVIEDSLIDGMRGTDGAHLDGIQVMGGSDIVFRNNWIDPTSAPIPGGGVNAAIFVSPENDAGSSDVTVECNMILGGDSWYPLRIYNTGGTVVVRGNRFGRDFLGIPVHLVETAVTTWEDNRYADDDEEIPAP